MVIFVKRLAYSSMQETGEVFFLRGKVPLRRSVEKDGDGHDLDKILDGNAVISRQHGSLESNEEGKLLLMDKGSRNGTFVRRASAGANSDSERLKVNELYKLEVGDIFSLGPMSSNKQKERETNEKKQALI